jgi:putative hydrolase of the HAD superfamily
MQIEAVLFDLDDTLVVEQPAADAAFLAACELARERHGVDPERFHQTVRVRAEGLWFAAPTYPYCRRVGISSWEGLWAGFAGDDPNLVALRTWAPQYRHDAWKLALRDHGILDRLLADELSEAFIRERRTRHTLFPDAEPTLRDLAGTYRLALVTNGPPDLQGEKIDAAGIRSYFESIVLSGEVGVGKPDPRIFLAALSELVIPETHAVMVGDSLHRDIAGALGVGIHGIWINRTRAAADVDVAPSAEIADLRELASALRDLER